MSMSYKSVQRLAGLARECDLLDDPMIDCYLRMAAIDDDPGLLKDAEEYIAYRGIDHMASRRQKNSKRSMPVRKAYQLV